MVHRPADTSLIVPCHICGASAELHLHYTERDEHEWTWRCPSCGNANTTRLDARLMNVTRRPAAGHR
jgi:hypothetical protein